MVKKEIFDIKMARIEFRVQCREEAALRSLAEGERTANDDCPPVDIFRNEWTDDDARESGQENQVMASQNERFHGS